VRAVSHQDGDADESEGEVLDFSFVALSIVFFVVAIGYVAACDRLMK
jgi:hypothetical protein